jgi:hypothetical protein
MEVKFTKSRIQDNNRPGKGKIRVSKESNQEKEIEIGDPSF